MNKSKLFIIILIMCMMIGQFATELYLPSMPSMAKYFKVHISEIQFTITAYTFGYAVGSFFCGYISDKLGRLKVALPCLLVSSIGGIICCLAMSTTMLLIGRVLQGIGLAGISVVARSIIRDISSSRNEFAKIASILGSVSAIAIALAPVVGGYIEKYLFWRINFIILFIFSIVLAWLCRYKLEETNKNLGKVALTEMSKDYLEVLTNKKFLLYNLVSSLTLAGFISYQTVSSFLLQVKIGLQPDQFGYTSIFVTLSMVIGGIFNGKIVERRGIDVMLKFGAKLYIVCGILYIIGGFFNYMTVISIVVPMMLFTFAAGVVYPNASSGALSIFMHNAGSAASIYNCFQMIGATIGSWIISMAVRYTQLPLGVMFIFIGLCGIIIYHYVKDNTEYGSL